MDLEADLELLVIPYLKPSPKQAAAISAVAIFGITALLGNALVFVGRIVASRDKFPLTGFDCLVLNLVFSNFFLVLLIYPYDVIAYVIFDRAWPFSNAYCYVSSVLTSIFPIVGCWTVVALTLHQLFAYASFVTSRQLIPVGTQTKWSKYVPVVIIWIYTLCIYTPVSQSLWVVDVNIYTCGLEAENGLLHDSVWYFWIPFCVSCMALLGMVVLHTQTHVPVPTERTDTVEPTVRWSDITTQETHQPNLDVYSSLNPLYTDFPLNGAVLAEERAGTNGTHKEDLTSLSSRSTASLVRSPGLAGRANNQPELHVENLHICLLFVGTLVVCVAPYAVILLLFHLSSEHKITIGLVFWDIGFTWMTTKPMWEPLVLLAISPTYRQALYCLFRRYRR